MKKLVIGVTSLSLLLVAATAIIVSRFLEPTSETPQKEDSAQ